MPRLKIHQHINITIRSKIVTQDGAKQRESADMMALTKSRNRFAANL